MSKVDRQTTTPFLLKLFYRRNDFHRLDEFTPHHQPAEYLQIYTWLTCSLLELAQLVQSAMPNTFPSPAAGTRVAFRLVYPDMQGAIHNSNSQGRYCTKDMGSVVIGAEDERSTIRGDDHLEAEKCLQDFKFVIGDWVTCVILPPLANGDVAPVPNSLVVGRGTFGNPPGRGTFGGGPRENGFTRGRRGAYGQSSGSAFPSGEWRRGERIPEGPSHRGNWARGRGRW